MAQQQSLFSDLQLIQMAGGLFANIGENNGENCGENPAAASAGPADRPETVLGQTFPSAKARRDHFRRILREKLPELRKTPGFPQAEDDDIINLSDPPYYTPCPNPWTADLIRQWESEKPDEAADKPVETPYAADVSEGKNNPIYMYHSYLTKVPHTAIEKYIDHYTRPGDIMLDGFCGSGMTGVAATLKGRKCVCSDLSPLATFIAYSYLSGHNTQEFIRTANAILQKVEQEYGWMYKTRHTNGEEATINHIVWSEVYECPNCNNEIDFWNDGVNPETGEFLPMLKCPTCSFSAKKEELHRIMDDYTDPVLKVEIERRKTKLVLIHYSYKGKIYIKKPDAEDLNIVDKCYNLILTRKRNYTEIMPEGREGKRNVNIGITHTHQFYSLRSYFILSKIKDLLPESVYNTIITKNAFVSSLQNVYRFQPKRLQWRSGGILKGTFYMPSMIAEINILKKTELFIKHRSNLEALAGRHDTAIGVQSLTSASTVPANSIDYIFTDPPFGDNLFYSTLNSVAEAWLGVTTNNEEETIVDASVKKTLQDYKRLMGRCMREYYRVLKPGKWMTLIFSNTSSAVWNAIRTAIENVGFAIAAVNTLDKKQLSFKAVTTTVAVKQDMVLSCYKPAPSGADATNADSAAEPVIPIWDFVSDYLAHLPVHAKKENNTTTVIERSGRILYDHVVAYYVGRGLRVPLDSAEFQVQLAGRYQERDGMFFTASQAAEYERLRARTDGFVPMGLVICDEANGIEWLRLRLSREPQTYQQLQPEWLRAIGGWRKGDRQPELRQLLEENFIEEAGGLWRAPRIGDMRDVETLRQKTLMREFALYVAEARGERPRRLQQVRAEAVKAGFREAWGRKDKATLLAVLAVLPPSLAEEDTELARYAAMALAEE